MPHLPNEIWLLIASYCEPRDLWLLLRLVNRQLYECAEQHFECELLPQIILNLPVAIPTYDMRKRTRGTAIFHIDENSSLGHHSDRVSYCLSGSEPGLYRTHILSCWGRMCNSAGGSLNENTVWEMQLGERIDTARLRRPSVDTSQNNSDDQARVSFDWRPAMTSFFR